MDFRRNNDFDLSLQHPLGISAGEALPVSLCEARLLRSLWLRDFGWHRDEALLIFLFPTRWPMYDRCLRRVVPGL